MSLHSLRREPAAQPVAPRSRGRRVLGFMAGGILLMLLLLVIGIPLLIVGLLAGGNLEFNVDEERRFSPRSAAEFPFVTDTDAGKIIIDLSDLSNEDFADRSAPALIDVELNAGEIVLVVPENLDADIDAEVTFGELRVFGDEESGFDSDGTVDVEDEVLEIELDLLAGNIQVVRDLSASSIFLEVG